MKIFESLTFGELTFQNRVVMAPMNRRRSFNNIPPTSMPSYYAQRSTAGLIITDNIAVLPNGVGYQNTPGIYTEEQIHAWKQVVNAVHKNGGKIFAQLVHNGRIGHIQIQNNEPLVAPSVIRGEGVIKTPDGKHKHMSVPLALKTEEIDHYVQSFRNASRNAIDIGFDGVEIHAAHGFLIDQFLNSNTNFREDQYGGSLENRIRFLSEVIESVVSEIGAERVGIRLSPFKTFYGAGRYPDEKETHLKVIELLSHLGIIYIHFSNEIIDGKESLTPEYLLEVRNIYPNILMAAGEYNLKSGNKLIEMELLDMVAFGRLFISNPDLIYRFENDLPLTPWDEQTFYHGGDLGYIDYPTYKESKQIDTNK